MANVFVEKQSLVNAADAIRTKLAYQDLIKPEDFATEISKIEGGGVKPTTWAELKTMTVTDCQAVYPVGSTLDLECKWLTSLSTGTQTTYDFLWQVARYGTCLLENDATEYPCVELWAKLATPFTLPFDGGERTQCDSATELVAEANVYYYGTTSASTSISTSNTRALNLATGDAIPYSSYTKVFKSSLDTTVTNFVNIYSFGYNNYLLSNLRAYLCSTSNTTGWFIPSHVGDQLASEFNNHRGFQSGFSQDFLNVVAPAKVTVLTNPVTDGGREDVMYDKFYLPSYRELRIATTPAEGEPYEFVQMPADRCRYYLGGMAMPASVSNVEHWVRSAYPYNSCTQYLVQNIGNENHAYTNFSIRFAPACKIILAGA